MSHRRRERCGRSRRGGIPRDRARRLTGAGRAWQCWFGLFLLLRLAPLFFAPAPAADRPDPRPGPGALTPESTRPLFNGTNLAGWHTWLVDSGRSDPRKVFTVASAVIRISGEGLGYLATEEAYQDYRLTVEFRWGRTNWSWGDRVGRARDSGVFLHATGPDGNSHDGQGAFQAALECQIMQGAVGDILLIRGTAADGTLIAPEVTVEAAAEPDAEGWPRWRRGGSDRTLRRMGRVNWSRKDPGWRDELDFRGPHDAESPSGEWTRVECRCEGPRVEIRVNGVLVNAADKVFPRRGRILLQCEGSEIFFRRVELAPLSAPRELREMGPRRF